jgi:hypothetical protein
MKQSCWEGYKAQQQVPCPENIQPFVKKRDTLNIIGNHDWRTEEKMILRLI